MYNQCVQAPCHIGVKDIYEYATCTSPIMHLICPPPPKKKRAHRVWQNLPVNGENTEENTATQKRGNYKEMYGFSVRPYIS